MQPNTLPEVENTEIDNVMTCKEEQGCLHTEEDLQSASCILEEDIKQVDQEQIGVAKKKSISFVKQFRYLTKHKSQYAHILSSEICLLMPQSLFQKMWNSRMESQNIKRRNYQSLLPKNVSGIPVFCIFCKSLEIGNSLTKNVLDM